ncbi:hypothetical protein Ancab_021614 [Ancistrocladus abbreviatus]
MNSLDFILLAAMLVAGLVSAASAQKLPAPSQDLEYGYYQDTCGDFEAIVSKKVKHWFQKDHTIAPSLIRLHFHDCAVRGCDASILLNTPGSERTAAVSKTLRGFEVIDDIKAELEKKCPRTVSCADIVTAAARDATFLLQGPFWANQYGRKDGKESYAEEANKVPMGHENVTHLIEFFQSKGLSVLDLVVLSGAHTIGRTTCGSIQYRLYNYKGTGKPDPTIAPKLVDYLRRKCRDPSHYVDLDPTTPEVFDNVYYMNLEKKMGILGTDQLLQSDARTTGLVNSFATQPTLFPYMFSSSMISLGNIVQDDAGEVRLHCSRVNA